MLPEPPRMRTRAGRRVAAWLADHAERLNRAPQWAQWILVLIPFGLLLLLVSFYGWPFFRTFLAIYVLVNWVSLFRANRKLRKANAYLADRLERTEPRPITVLDGFGRDISHLNEPEPADSPRRVWLERLGGVEQDDGSWIVPPQPESTFRHLSQEDARKLWDEEMARRIESA